MRLPEVAVRVGAGLAGGVGDGISCVGGAGNRRRGIRRPGELALATGMP
jgi:hypothetical protein